MDDDKTADRVEKLLRKAEGTDNQHEKEAFYAKAQQIATASQIEAALARMAGRATGKPIRQDFQMGEPGSSSFLAMSRLFRKTADSNDVFVCAFEDTAEIWAYGYVEDIQLTLVLYCSLHLQMLDACEKFLKGLPPLKAGKLLEARRSFYEGYAERIGELLWQAKSAAADEHAAGGAALALRGKRGEVQDFYEADRLKHGIVTRSGRGGGGFNPLAAAAGDAAARNARLAGNDNLTGTRLALTG